MVKKDFFGESKNVEFKREIPRNHEKFLKDIIAFSNSTGVRLLWELKMRHVLCMELVNKVHLSYQIQYPI